MVPKCDDINASGKQLGLYWPRNATPGRCIFSICDDEVDTKVPNQLWKLLANHIATSLTDNVPKKENSHRLGFHVVDIGLVYQLNPSHC